MERRPGPAAVGCRSRSSRARHAVEPQMRGDGFAKYIFYIGQPPASHCCSVSRVQPETRGHVLQIAPGDGWPAHEPAVQLFTGSVVVVVPAGMSGPVHCMPVSDHELPSAATVTSSPVPMSPSESVAEQV